MLRNIYSLLIICTITSSCFNAPIQSVGTVAQGRKFAAFVNATDVSTTKSITTIDSKATDPLKLSVSSSNELKGTSITISPGSLQISTTIVIEQGADFADSSASSEVYLANDVTVTNAGNGIIIRPSENSVLSKPIQLNLPLPVLTGLRLAGDIHYAVYYKYLDPTSNQLVTGFRVVNGDNVKLVYDQDSKQDTIQLEGFFGIYWVVSLSRAVLPAEIEAPKASIIPIVNKSNTVVMNTTGVVKESAIVATQAIPELLWPKPTLSFDAASRSVKISVNVDANFGASACKVDLFESTTSLKGISVDTSSLTGVTISIQKLAAHKLIGRFVCVDPQTRTSLSPWSDAVALEAYTLATILSVDTTATAGFYKELAEIPIAVVWNRPVVVEGIPSLFLNLSGSPAKHEAVYVSGSGTTTLLFKYIVTSGEESADLNYAQTNSLLLNEKGLIKDSNAVAAVLDLPDPAQERSLGGHNAIVVDAVSPLAPATVSLANAYTHSATVSMNWAAARDVNFKDFTIQFCTLNTCSGSCSSPATFTSSPGSISGLAEGSYYACVKQSDLANNISKTTTSAGTVTVDFTPPTVNAGTDVSARIPFSLAASGAGSTYAWTKVSGPGSVTFSDNASLYSTVTPTVDGVYVIRLMATDLAGNTATDDMNITWDTTPPTFAGIDELMRLPGNTSAYLFWKPAVDNIAKPWEIIYDICYSMTPGQCLSSFTATTTVGPNIYDVKITGLSSASDYEFVVHARDLHGNMDTNTMVKKNDGLAGVTSIATGYLHTCVILTNGTVKCWGLNDYGQLGDGTFMDRKAPVTVPNLSNVQSLSLGNYHSCAVTIASALYCWGMGGPIGGGVASGSNMPSAVTGLGNVAAVAAGNQFTCAIASGGVVYCWGYNASGQLGNGTTADSMSPVNTGITSATTLTAGDSHVCALAGGLIKCWGMNNDGQLGNGNTINQAIPVTLGAIGSVSSISAGASHTCALTSGSSVYCWGLNTYGQVGDLTNVNKSVPTVVSSLAASYLVAGDNHTCAVTTTNTVKCWGLNNFGQLGDNTSKNQSGPVLVNGLSGISKVSAGAGITCATSVSGGYISCWGQQFRGQLGQDTDERRYAPVRSLNPNGTTLKIVSGQSHSCSLLSNQQVNCWGKGLFGNLGDNTLSPHYTPQPVSVLTAATQLAAGLNHNCAINAGSVYCWGSNNLGQDGDGTIVNKLIPTLVSLATPSFVATGANHSCAVISGGAVKCWGQNTNGQLGNGSTTASNVPVAVTGLTNVIALSLSGDFSCAVLDAGAGVKCWGANSYGQLGNSTFTDSSIPVISNGANGAISMASGGNHSCTVNSGGGVQCWGYGSYGELGDGASAHRNVPTLIFSLTNVTKIAAGSNHTCAQLADNSVKCWGLGTSGQLGNFSSTGANVPVALNWLGTTSTRLYLSGFYSCVGRADGNSTCFGGSESAVFAGANHSIIQGPNRVAPGA
ncbi:MAG: hypothetical protein H7318_13330 [Oligoflexus sp.]|nr:hypothetical protein [Oligoflexus sp.]